MARYKIQFWLNSQKPDELMVADTVAELKLHRSFSAVVRDGIMIVNELRQGRVDLLLKLYPFVKDAIAEILPPPVPPTPPPMDIATLMREFQRMMDERGRGATIPDTRDYGIPAAKPLASAMGQGTIAGASKPMALPTFDDDDGGEDTIVLNKSTGKMNGENAIAAMLKIAF